MPPLVSKIKKILVENGSMNYWRLLFFFISDNTGVRELAPYPTDKKTKAREDGKRKKIFRTTIEMCALKPNCCLFMTFFDNSIIHSTRPSVASEINFSESNTDGSGFRRTFLRLLDGPLKNFYQEIDHLKI